LLDTQPTADVTIAVSSSNTAEGTVSTNLLTFTPANYAVPQVVTVTGANDSAADWDQHYTINLGPAASADPEYYKLELPAVPATNIHDESQRLRVFRAYDPGTGFHFFTTSQMQFDNAIQHGFVDETSGRTGFAILPDAGSGGMPLYRLYNLQTGEHYYTLNAIERNSLVSLIPPDHPQFGTLGWRDEGIEGYLFDSTGHAGTTLIYRLYNIHSGEHLLTQSQYVRDSILAQFPSIWIEHSPLGYALFAPTEDAAGSQSAPAVSPEKTLPVSVFTTEENDVTADFGSPAMTGLAATPSCNSIPLKSATGITNGSAAEGSSNNENARFLFNVESTDQILESAGRVPPSIDVNFLDETWKNGVEQELYGL